MNTNSASCNCHMRVGIGCSFWPPPLFLSGKSQVKMENIMGSLDEGTKAQNQ